MEARTATIVGAGIGGLATALALGRAGYDVEVLERATSIDGGGAGLALAPNAVHALRALGVADEVVAGATVLGSTVLRSARGRDLSRVRTDEVAERCGAPAIGVTRAALVEVLATALGPGVVRLGQEVADPRDLRLGLVVGADGIGSVVRRSWWPDRWPRYAGYTAWRALVQDQDCGPSRTATETWGSGERFGMVPVGRGELYVYATASMPPQQAIPDDMSELRRRFSSWHDPIPQVLDRLAGATILRHDVSELAAPPSLHLCTGQRVVALVGDAGHAMQPNLGQGAGTALEDAVELAYWLGSGPIEQALARYSASRLSRVGPMTRRSRQVGRIAQLRSPALAAVRNAAFRAAPDRAGHTAAVAVAGWRPPARSTP